MQTPYTEREKSLHDRFEAAKSHRQWKEEYWDEYNFAYQMITNVYERKRVQGIDPMIILDSLENDTALSQINLPVEFSVIIRKTAEEMRSLPNYKWISLSKKDNEAKGKLFSNIFQWVWYEALGDIEVFKALLAKNIYGDSFIWAFHESRDLVNNCPYLDSESDELKWKKKPAKISRTRILNLDIRSVFLDPGALTIEDAEYAFIERFVTEDTAHVLFDRYVKVSKYKWDDFKKTSQRQTNFSNVGETRESPTAEFYNVKYYYNQLKDEFVILIDDRIVHDKYIVAAPDDGVKRIPIAHLKDHHLDGEFYGTGESAIVKPHREVKNNLVNLTFDVSRQAAFGTLLISPYADFDEEDFEWGQPFVRLEPQLVDQMKVSANLGWVNQFGDYMENQQIVSTGINHMDAAQSGQETATKSLQRRESQMLIVEAGMKYNVAAGFTRLGLILKDLIRLHYQSYPTNDRTSKSRRIRVDGYKFVRKGGKLDYEKVKDYTYFDVEPQDLEDDFDLVLELGNIAMSKSIELDLQLLGVDRIMNLPPLMTAEGQQKQVYNVEEMAKFIQSKFSLPKEVINVEDEGMKKEDFMREAEQGLLYKEDDAKTFVQNQEMAQGAAGMGQGIGDQANTGRARSMEGAGTPPIVPGNIPSP